MSTILSIPRCVLAYQVFALLDDPNDLIRCAQTCWEWYTALQEHGDMLWSRLYRSRWPCDPLGYPGRDPAPRFSHPTFSQSTGGQIVWDWKSEYLCRRRVHSQWESQQLEQYSIKISARQHGESTCIALATLASGTQAQHIPPVDTVQVDDDSHDTHSNQHLLQNYPRRHNDDDDDDHHHHRPAIRPILPIKERDVALVTGTMRGRVLLHVLRMCQKSTGGTNNEMELDRGKNSDDIQVSNVTVLPRRHGAVVLCATTYPVDPIPTPPTPRAVPPRPRGRRQSSQDSICLGVASGGPDGLIILHRVTLSRHTAHAPPHPATSPTAAATTTTTTTPPTTSSRPTRTTSWVVEDAQGCDLWIRGWPRLESRSCTSLATLPSQTGVLYAGDSRGDIHAIHLPTTRPFAPITTTTTTTTPTLEGASTRYRPKQGAQIIRTWHAHSMAIQSIDISLSGDTLLTTDCGEIALWKLPADPHNHPGSTPTPQGSEPTDPVGPSTPPPLISRCDLTPLLDHTLQAHGTPSLATWNDFGQVTIGLGDGSLHSHVSSVAMTSQVKDRSRVRRGRQYHHRSPARMPLRQRQQHHLNAHALGVTGLCALGSLAVTTSYTATVHLWNTSTHQLLGQYYIGKAAEESPMFSIRAGPDNNNNNNTNNNNWQHPSVGGTTTTTTTTDGDVVMDGGVVIDGSGASSSPQRPTWQRLHGTSGYSDVASTADMSLLACVTTAADHIVIITTPLS